MKEREGERRERVREDSESRLVFPLALSSSEKSERLLLFLALSRSLSCSNQASKQELRQSTYDRHGSAHFAIERNRSRRGETRWREEKEVFLTKLCGRYNEERLFVSLSLSLSRSHTFRSFLSFAIERKALRLLLFLCSSQDSRRALTVSSSAAPPRPLEQKHRAKRLCSVSFLVPFIRPLLAIEL